LKLPLPDDERWALIELGVDSPRYGHDFEPNVSADTLQRLLDKGFVEKKPDVFGQDLFHGTPLGGRALDLDERCRESGLWVVDPQPTKQEPNG
jgi:hypothetical protein